MEGEPGSSIERSPNTKKERSTVNTNNVDHEKKDKVSAGSSLLKESSNRSVVSSFEALGRSFLFTEQPENTSRYLIILRESLPYSCFLPSRIIDAPYSFN